MSVKATSATLASPLQFWPPAPSPRRRVYSLLLLAPWPGYSPAASRTLSAIWAVFWVIGVWAIQWRQRGRFWASLAWWYAFAAPLSMLAQGSLTRVGGSLLGLPYFAAAAALGFTLKRTFDRERQRRTEQHPDGLPQRQ
jgi:uncharacterized membrane protein YfcA